MSKEDHALVPLGEYKVPLIGLPPSATLQECGLCHEEFPLNEVELGNSGQMLCRKCREEKKDKHEKQTDH